MGINNDQVGQFIGGRWVNYLSVVTMISVHADASLNRIVAKTGMKKQEAIERAVLELAEALQCNF
ncbi:MAG: hypothetical protein V2A69_06985 [Pseudomonadota bacterium]